MYQAIHYEKRKNKIHVWDDLKGHLIVPYRKYAYVKNSTGLHYTLDGDKVKKARITLRKGSEVVGEETTKGNGKFKIKKLEEGEYFTRENSLKPLLHTWSLSIEMQFYIIFPVIILILEKIKKFKIIIIALICFISFLTANWFALTNPDAAFYFSLSRGWEILLGSLCALLKMRFKKIKFNQSEYVCYIS